MQFCEIRAFGEPVVHLGINVDRVLRAPGWVDRLVPDALQICGERAGARTRDKNVATELEVDRQEMNVLAAGLDRGDALVCGNCCLGVRTEADGRSAKV